MKVKLPIGLLLLTGLVFVALTTEWGSSKATGWTTDIRLFDVNLPHWLLFAAAVAICLIQGLRIRVFGHLRFAWTCFCQSTAVSTRDTVGMITTSSTPSIASAPCSPVWGLSSSLELNAEFLIMRSFCFVKLALRLRAATRLCTPFI